MFNRITQCPYFKDRIKNVAFVTAVLIIVVGIWECGLFGYRPKYDEFVFWLVIPLLIFFFLWKTNYFVRNKC